MNVVNVQEHRNSKGDTARCATQTLGGDPGHHWATRAAATRGVVDVEASGGRDKFCEGKSQLRRVELISPVPAGGKIGSRAHWPGD